MSTLSCGAVQARLPAYHDRELPIRELLRIEAHVNACARCTREVDALRDVGDALRAAAAPVPADRWTGVQGAVISRMRAEAAESLGARAGRLLDEVHLLWIGLASTAATILCGALALSALHFASPERDDSLRAMIHVISAPAGSNLNPLRVGRSLQVPSVPEHGVIEAMLAQPVSREELTLALSAVVTREGRVSGVSVLANPNSREDISTMLDVLSRGRLEPGRVGSHPVAVSLVWLVTHTTVTAKAPPHAI